MSRRPQMPRFQHSLWDRLINPELVRGADVAVTASSEIERIKNEVRRDLEWLLNSRSSPFEIPTDLDALQQSVVRYGLPDLTSLNLSNPKERERFQGVLQTVIRDFEPRLDHVEVRVSTQEQKDGGRPSVHYRVEAMLKLDPTPLSVVFDTVLELGTKTFRVE
jgi:type VI secretion system protein ImpF